MMINVPIHCGIPWNPQWCLLLYVVIVIAGPVASGDLSDIHAFTVRYRENEDRLLDTHVDSSDVTLNLCLGGSFEGGGNMWQSHMTQTLQWWDWNLPNVNKCHMLCKLIAIIWFCLRKTWLNWTVFIVWLIVWFIMPISCCLRQPSVWACSRRCLFPRLCWWGPRSHGLTPPGALLPLSRQSSAPQRDSPDSPGKSHPRSPPTPPGTPHQLDPLVPGRPQGGRPPGAGLIPIETWASRS